MADLRKAVTFYVGLHQPSDAHRFERACISIRRLWTRRKPIAGVSVLVDSGAFRELELYGKYRESVEAYARRLFELHTRGIINIVAAVAQDYMCEPFMLAKTGLTIADHQRLTIERYDALRAELRRLFGGEPPFPIMPVLQGYAPADYARHLAAYGDRLTPGMWVGVGSVCKRNSTPGKIAAVLRAITAVRADLLLHGFGVKLTALLDPEVRELLATADSMAWSFAQRYQGGSPNDWRGAMAFSERVQAAALLPRSPYQLQLFEAE